MINTGHCRPGSALQIAAWVMGCGTLLVLTMATLAFGPSGLGFGLVIAIAVFWLMVNRYRYSLRTFVIVTTVFGIWLGLKMGYDLKMQRAVTGIVSAGGQLKIHDRRADFPWGLWAERYDLYFDKLPGPLSGEQLTHLRTLAPSSLYWLSLENTGITDDNMDILRRCKGLEYLSLANRTYWGGSRIPGYPQNSISDTGVAELRGLRTLKGIDLSGTDVTDECVTYLSELPSLTWIYLSSTKMTGAGISRLAKLKSLWMLELNGCQISADGFKELSQLRNVMSLGLHNTGMTDENLDDLNAMPQLDILRLGKNVSNEAIQRFSDVHPRCKIER